MSISLPRQLPSNLIASLETGWHQIRHELIYISWALMEVALITPVAMAFMSWTRYWPPRLVATLLFLILMLPINLTRLMRHSGWRQKRQQWVLFFALPVVIFIANGMLVYQHSNIFDLSWIPKLFAHLAERGNLHWLRDLTVFILITIVWGRGTALMNRHFKVKKAGLLLRIGGLILAPLTIWLGQTRLQWGTAPFLLLFFATGLTAVAFIRAEEIENQRSGQSAYLSPRWVSHIVLTTFLICFVTGSIVLLLTEESATAVIGWLAPVWTAVSFASTVIGIAFTYVLLPILTLVGYLVEGVYTLFTHIFGEVNWFNPQPNGSFNDSQILTLSDLTTAAQNLPLTGKIILFVISGLIIILGALVLVHMRRVKLAAMHGTPITQRNSSDRDKLGLAEKLLDKLGLLRDWYAAASIRRVYKQMVKAATVSGYPRPDTETAYEYLDSLRKVWPSHHTECQLITEAFIKIRYGELPETKEELAMIINAWQKLEQSEPMRLTERQQAQHQ